MAGICLAAALAGQPVRGEEPDEAAVRNLVDVLTGSRRTGQTFYEAINEAIRRLEQQHVPPEVAMPALIPLLDHPSFDTRSYAARALKIFGPNAAPAVPALTRRLDDPTRNVRFYVAETLVAIGPKAAPAVAALGRAAGDPASGIQQTAARALAAIGPAAEDAVPGLIAALGSKWREVRWEAAGALAAIGPGAADAVPALAKALRDRERALVNPPRARSGLSALRPFRPWWLPWTNRIDSFGCAPYPHSPTWVRPDKAPSKRCNELPRPTISQACAA